MSKLQKNNVDFVKTYISENLKNINGPEDIARELNISYNTLRRKFRCKEKITLGKFIRLRKIHEMKKLLASTDLYCYEICDEVGYSEIAGGKLFKKTTNMTMCKFRENSKKKRTEKVV